MAGFCTSKVITFLNLTLIELYSCFDYLLLNEYYKRTFGFHICLNLIFLNTVGKNSLSKGKKREN